MKMEWKFFETFRIFRKKWKQNEDMETKMEFCKMEMETELFLVEVETETKQRFPAEQTRKWNFHF
jgi:hypothetical protein